MRAIPHIKQRSVRITAGFLDALTAEAEKTGLGKPSVLLRMLVSEKIFSQDDLKDSNLAKLCDLGREIGTHGALDRLTIRFNEEADAILQKELDKHASGKFSVFVTGILADRYGNSAPKNTKPAEKKSRPTGLAAPHG